MEIQINKSVIELCQGDITKQEVDAIVNAANSRLAGGGGVDGAIHRAGGPAIMAECRKIGGCPTGSAVITTGGNLPARHVIHTVGPVYRDGKSDEPELLKNAYLNSLKAAEKTGIKTIAFPSISTGVYGYPIKDASKIALSTVIDYLKGETGIEHAVFVLFSAQDFETYTKTLKEIQPE
jgi:O-acetyl-ADP-ribose deacetylase (regulator of RNase III)